MKEIKTKLEEIENKQKEEKEKNAEIEEKIKKCFQFATEKKGGLIAFKIINLLCLWSETTANTNSENELYKRGRRDIWNLIRRYIPQEKLAKIEIFEPITEEDLKKGNLWN